MKSKTHEADKSLNEYLATLPPSAPEWNLIADLVDYEWSLVLARENMELACLWANIDIELGRKRLFVARKR